MPGPRRLTTAVLVAAAAAATVLTASPAVAVEHHRTVATGLDNPRHLQFGADGVLYVAEAGRGGDRACRVVEGRDTCFGDTGAVTAIGRDGQRRVVTGLPSQAGEGGAYAIGPADVAPTPGGRLLVLQGYAEDPSVRADLPPDLADVGWLLRADPRTGRTERFADITGFEATANPDGVDPLYSNPFAVLARGSGAVVVDAGGNSLVSVDRDGDVAPLATFPTREQTVGVALPDGPPVGTRIPAQSVPTSVTAQHGTLVVGELTGFPYAQGGAQLYGVRRGDVQVRARGFTSVIDVEAGPRGSLYVLELATAGLLAVPPGELPSGRLLRLDRSGAAPVVVAEDLPAPGGIAVRRGTVYVTVNSVLAGAGSVIAVAG